MKKEKVPGEVMGMCERGTGRPSVLTLEADTALFTKRSCVSLCHPGDWSPYVCQKGEKKLERNLLFLFSLYLPGVFEIKKK